MAHYKIEKIKKILDEFSPAIKTIEARGYSKDAAIMMLCMFRLEDAIDNLEASLFEDSPEPDEWRDDEQSTSGL